MTHERFSESDTWELANPEDDLRGRNVLDGEGAPLGRVEDMLVDTATQSIDAIVLEDGRRIPAARLDISGPDLRVTGGALRDLADADRMRGTELEEELRQE